MSGGHQMMLGGQSKPPNMGPIDMRTAQGAGYTGYVAGVAGTITPDNWNGKVLDRCADSPGGGLQIAFLHGGTPLPQNFWSTLDIQGMNLPLFDSAAALAFTPDDGGGRSIWAFTPAGLSAAGRYFLVFTP